MGADVHQGAAFCLEALSCGLLSCALSYALLFVWMMKLANPFASLHCFTQQLQIKLYTDLDFDPKPRTLASGVP